MDYDFRQHRRRHGKLAQEVNPHDVLQNSSNDANGVLELGMTVYAAKKEAKELRQTFYDLNEKYNPEIIAVDALEKLINTLNSNYVD